MALTRENLMQIEYCLLRINSPAIVPPEHYLSGQPEKARTPWSIPEKPKRHITVRLL